MRRASILALAIGLTHGPAIAQTDWFPAQLEEAAAQQLLARLVEIGVEPQTSEPEQIAGARGAVRDLATRIDEWGVEGVLQNAPDVSQVELPDFEDRLVDAIATYGVCSLPLHPELASNQDELIFVAIGELSVVMVSALLRQHFLDNGGTDQQLADQLNTEVLNQLSHSVQMSAETREYVNEQCGPMFSALLGSGEARRPESDGS